MKVLFNLYVNFYVDRKPNRQYELQYCLSKNIACKGIDKIIIVLSRNHQRHFTEMLLSNNLTNESKKIQLVFSEKRPTYREWFSITRKYSDQKTISCIANTDILFEYSDVQKIKSYRFGINTCFAISRWDIVNENDLSTSKIFARSDSQDTWITKGSFVDVQQANFPLGIAGCDNKIAHLLEVSGYKLINPCKSIKTHHFHKSNVRNYIVNSNVERIPPPYAKVEPCNI